MHFPWCVRKCPYCDFNSHPLHGGLDEARYLRALLEDLNSAQATWPTDITTVFFGGGTPSLFSPGSFATLCQALACAGEVTMEANPGASEHAEFGGYLEAGINRLSLGAQSFDDEMLSRLGRIHAATDTRAAFAAAREAGFDNINLDLMYALPGQSVAGALEDLRAAVSLAPEHVSWYQLTLEPKTEFYQRPPVLPEDGLVAEIEAAGYELLTEAGYERYEVSAWAQPGRRCEHNVNYWSFGDYLGIGAGAHGKIAGLRTEKPKAPSRYLQEPAAVTKQEIKRDAVVFEVMMNALRLVDGISWARFEEATEIDAQTLAEPWRALHEQGLVERDRVQTTPFGFRHLDAVVASFLPA